MGTPVVDRRVFAVGAGALAVAVLATCVTLAFDSEFIATLAQRERLVFGWPFGWLQQSQLIDPPLPWRVQFASPWDNPTDVLWPQFLASALTIWAGLVAIAGGVRWLAAQSRADTWSASH